MSTPGVCAQGVTRATASRSRANLDCPQDHPHPRGTMAAAIGGQCAGAARGGVTGALREAMPPGRGAQYGGRPWDSVKGQSERWCAEAPRRPAETTPLTARAGLNARDVSPGDRACGVPGLRAGGRCPRSRRHRPTQSWSLVAIARAERCHIFAHSARILVVDRAPAGSTTASLRLDPKRLPDVQPARIDDRGRITRASSLGAQGHLSAGDAPVMRWRCVPGHRIGQGRHSDRARTAAARRLKRFRVQAGTLGGSPR